METETSNIQGEESPKMPSPEGPKLTDADVEETQGQSKEETAQKMSSPCCCGCTWKRIFIWTLIGVPVAVCIFFIYFRIAYKGFFAPRCSKPRKEIQTIDSLDACIQEIHEKYNFVGISVSIITMDDDDIGWSQNYGFASLEDQTQTTSDTPYLLSSVSKTFIATAIMQQVEIGVLDLDENINAYLPFEADNPLVDGEVITLRDLSTHTSGIVDGPAYDASYAPGDPEEGLGEFLESYLVLGGVHYSNSNFNDCQSGDCPYEYSNVGAALAGYVLEATLDISFAQYVEENILSPLGMNNSHFYLDKYTDPNVIAMPYEEGDKRGELEEYGYYGYPTYPDGRLFSSTNDMARYMAAFLSDDEILMSTESQNEMLTVQLIDQKVSFSERLFFGNVEQEIFWVKINEVSQGHDGGDYGSFTLMYYEPKQKVGIIILTNYAELNGAIALMNIVKQVTQQSAHVAALLRGL